MRAREVEETASGRLEPMRSRLVRGDVRNTDIELSVERYRVMEPVNIQRETPEGAISWI